jgi:diguanylate cyclase (GGDEF)-like protein/hemerythrin-like metal-binding protein/PAS domain S-box-containing protein
VQSIDIFPWDDKFNTGLDTVDKQHKKLVEILNRLATHIAYESDKEDLNKIFDELAEYALYHFETEEAIWNEYFPNDFLCCEHAQVHKKFLDTTLSFKKKQDKESPARLAEEVIIFLVKWLVSHILDDDRHLAYIVFALQKGESLHEAKNSAKEQMSVSNHLLIDIILSIYSALSTNTISLMAELKVHRIFEKKMKYQENYRKLLLNLSASFINLPLDKIDFAIQNSLQSIATFVGADRAYIFDYNIDAQTTSNTYEWCAQNISPEIDNLQNLPIDMLGEWLDFHSKGENVLIQDVKGLQEGALRDILVSQKIQSLVTIPLMEGSVCKGFIGFDAVKTKYEFSESEIEFLEHFSKLFANVNERKHVESELMHERSFLKTLIQTIPDLVWLKDTDGTYLACNRRFEEFFGAKEAEIVGRSDYDFVDKELADSFRMNDAKAMQSNKLSVNEEEVSFASDGHKEILHTTKTSMHDINGNLIGVLGVSRDITELKKTSNELKDQRMMLEAILDNAPIGIWMSSSEGQMKFVNKTFCEATGITEKEFLSTKYTNLLPEDVSPNCMKSDAECILLDSGVHTSVEVLPFTDGQNHVLEITKVKLNNADNEIFIIGLAADITERLQQQKHLEYIAHYDALTGLPNRVLLSDRIRQALIQTNRHKLSFAVVYLDLDGFKEVNDQHGHDNGDKLLEILAKQMKKALRDGDTIARLGGDEFVAVLLDLKSHEDSVPMLRRLLKASLHKVEVDDIEMQVTASLGVTFYDAGDDIDADQLLRQADQAMYQAKLSGKNRYYIFDAQKDEKTRTHHESLEEIEKALENEEFVLYYQPKVNMRSGKVIGAEALIRWNHPQHGILLPGTFLPVIKDHFLSVKLGEWVIKSAMEQISIFNKNGIKFPISVNVDAMQLQQNDFVQQLENLLKEYPHVDPRNLILEVLETSALEDIVYISQIMQKCRKIGISFSLDDFGTGYSSLTYLKRLPAKELKIDQSFVFGMLEDPEDLAILDGVLGLASAFRREAIAEGVESIEHGEMLLKLGCERAQGFVIAYPMPAENMLSWVQEYKPDEKWQRTMPISRDDLPILYALVEHKAWLNNVLSYLHQMRQTPPKLNHEECRFGEWVYESGLDRYKDNYKFEVIEKIHRNMHDKTNEIIKKYDDNTIEDLDASINEINNLSQELIDIFKKFEVNKDDVKRVEL